jgi:NAD(P)H-quinone oxidoreductase subunit 2
MGGIHDYYRALGQMTPEFILVIGILFAAVWNLIAPKLRGLTPLVSLGTLLGAGVVLASTMGKTEKLFGGVFTVDPLYSTISLISIAVGIIVVLMSMGYDQFFGKNRGEFYAILLTAILANLFLAGSTDLVMLFVALETLSICCVLLAGFNKRDLKSGEASLKYLLSTAATTATLLYALSFLYGLSGSTSFDAIRDTLSFSASGGPTFFQYLILALVLSAIGFKLSAVPFHMWTPDVYEGAPTPVTAFLSIGSKAGGFVVAIRLLLTVFSQAQLQWAPMLCALAILSMIGGNLIALAQNSFKRMLAYSSIAHVGYILIGLVAASESGLSAMVFYMMVYGLMNLGAFAGAILFSNETGSDRIEDYAGLIRKRPLIAIGMSLCLLNLAGLPIPPAGFFAKVFIFASGAQITQTFLGMPMGWLLVTVALITSVPAIYYYSRVVILMIVPEPSEKVAALTAPNQPRPYLGSPQEAPAIALLICTVLVAAAGTLEVNTLMGFSKSAVAGLALHDSGNPVGYLPGSGTH